MRIRPRFPWRSLLLAATLLVAGFAAPASAQQTDTDGDTMPDEWETFFGLNPGSAADATADPDGDGLTNAQEFAAGRHPFGLFARYFAEGSTGYFDTRLAVLNLSTTATAHVSIALLTESGGVVSHLITLGPRARQSLSLDAILRTALGTTGAVSIIVESDVAVAADRVMTWGTTGVGLSLDSGSSAPATTWYFAEGATGPFLLYYLFENPGATPANVTVRYLREGGAPISTTRTLPPHSRTTVFVNDEDAALAVASLGAVVTSDVPILSERAMYLLSNGTFGGGSASSGSSTLSTQWYFGEGATGPFFHAFLSLMNPGPTAATATVTYHLSDGSTASKAYSVPADGRRTVYFNDEAATDTTLSALANGPVWFTVSSTQPILGERAMWWSTWPWYEGHAAVGSTMSDVAWGIAEGRHGGPMGDQTYVLVGNTTGTPGQVRVSVIPDVGAASSRDLPIAAGARLTINVGELFGLAESGFSVTVESLGATPVPLAVDYARYRSVNGLPFSGGGAAPAVPLVPADTPPSVTATVPAAGATGASSTNNLAVTFSEPVAAAAGAFTLACPTGTPIALTVVTTSPATQYTLDPGVPLPPLTTCTLTVLASAITDVDTTDPPDVMTADAVVSFTTAPENAPVVSSTTPAAGATQISLAANLTITFSEPVDVAGNWFQIVCATSGTRTVADTVVTGGPTTFTIDPNADFAAGELCAVTVVAAQVTDQDPIDPPDAMAANQVFSFTADVAPTVTATTPANGATSLGTATGLSVTFSEPVTVTGNWFQIVCGTSGTRTVADTVVAGGPTTFTIDPTADFAAGELCTVTIVAAQVSDQDAGDPPDTLAANVVFSFTIDTPPSVTATTPANGATGVAGNTTITVTFSEAVNALASHFTLQCNSVPVAFTLSASPAAAFTLTSTAPLPAGELCSVAIPPGVITDVDAGDPPDAMGASYVFSFTIDAAPSVTATTPTNGATGTTTNTNLTVTFSEPVNVTGNWFQVVCGASGTRNVADTAVSGGPTTFTINPNADFTDNELCTVTVFAAQVGDQDAADPPDAMAADYVFSFTADAAPSVTSTTPANGATVASNTDLSVTFSEPVNVTGNWFQIVCTASGTRNVAATVVTGGPTTFTANPNVDFTPGETCAVTIFAAQVADQDANDPPDTMLANAVGSFTVDAQPSVTAAAPTNGAVQVSTTANLAVTFNEAVNVTGNWFQVVCSTTGVRDVADTVVTGGPTAFTINPNVDFSSGETCTVTVFAAQVTDQDAIDPPDTMAANVVFSYTIDTAPAVTTTLPVDNATGVVPGATITVNFTESVNATTGSFSVVCNGVAQTFSLSPSPSASFVLTPATALPEGVVCTVTVFAVGITDADAGDPPDNMLANHAFAFSIPPNAVNDARSATGNVSIDTTVTGFSVLSNDIGPGIAITAFDAASVRGGTVSVNGAGLFTYTPPVGYEGTDSFNYTITNAAGSDSATVVITVSNMVWFIDNTAGACTTIAGGCGRRATPFSSLPSFEAVNGGFTMNGSDVIDPEAGDAIFIATGGALYAGPLTLEPNQRVIGQGATSSVATLAGITFAPDSVSVPITGGTKPTITSGGAGITLASNDQLHGLAFTTAGTAVSGPSNVGTFTMSEILVNNTSGAGISFTGGGTVTATGVNTIVTTTATALNVSNTTIGAGGLTFRSISANGSVNGILLSNSGSGGLTVTGDGGGSANGSGGVIQNTSGVGISLTSTGPVNLGYINVTAAGDDGIRGASVAGFTLSRSNVLNNGNAVGERGIDLTQLSGSGGITNSTISGSAETNVRIENDTANLTAFNVTGTTIATPNFTTGDDGFLVLDTGSASMTVSVTGSAFTDNKGDHFQAATDADATGPMNITFNNNTLTTTAPNDPNVLGGGITINTSGSTDITFQISNNNIQQAFDDAININLDPGSLAGASMNGTIANNTIGTAGVAGSGSESSNTITVASKGLGTTTIAVTNNVINEFVNAYGIFVGTTEGSSHVNATVTGNFVGNGDPVLALNGIRIDAGATAADNGLLEVTLAGNDVTGTGTAGNADIRLRQRFLTTVKLPGYAGANNDTAAVAAFVAANNDPAGPTAAPTVTVAENSAGGGGGFIGGPDLLLFAARGPRAASLEAPAIARTAGAAPTVASSASQEEVQVLVTEAIARWKATGIDSAQLAVLENLAFNLEPLVGHHLGSAGPGVVTLDEDASGQDWFVDPTPGDDSEFLPDASTRWAVDGADSRLDLLTAIAHEMGHALGLADRYDEAGRNDVMFGMLAAGERRAPARRQAQGTGGSARLTVR